MLNMRAFALFIINWVDEKIVKALFEEIFAEINNIVYDKIFGY